MGKLGETLRERRTALGISMEQAEEHTKMRARLLEALEAGAYEALPDPGYVRGYISSYARYLELDPLPLLAMYKAETGAGQSVKLDLPQAGEAVAPSGEQHALPVRAGLVAVLVVGALSLGGWAVASVLNGPEPTPPVPIAPTEPIEAGENETETVPASKPEPESEVEIETESETPEESDDLVVPFTLGVSVASDGASWLKIVVDGKPAYEGTLTGGQSKTFEVTEEASVRIGKRESVTLTRDGVPVDMRGNGDVPTVTLKAEPAR